MAYPLVPSPHVNRTSGRKIDVGVPHSMEMDEKGTTAESCARCSNPASRVSAHYRVDANSIVQCVREQDVAWHAPGCNHNGIGIEHAERARESDAQWLDRCSAAAPPRAAP